MAFLLSGNVSVVAVNSTSLTLQFQPPSLADRNGIISHYNIQLKRQRSGGVVVSEEASVHVENISSSIDAQNGEVVVEVGNLEEASTYRISIQACTKFGCSRYQFAGIAATTESGKQM